MKFLARLIPALLLVGGLIYCCSCVGGNAPVNQAVLQDVANEAGVVIPSGNVSAVAPMRAESPVAAWRRSANDGFYHHAP